MTRSDIDHYGGLTYWGPLSVARMEGILDLMTCSAGARVLDVGCGRGELLVRLAERHGVAATGVDRSAAALALTRAAFEARCPGAALTLLEQDVETLTLEPGAFDVVSWLGGPYLGASFEHTLSALRAALRPGGVLLIGHGFWASTPPAGYLEATSIPEEEMGAHIDNIDAGRACGLTLLYTCVSTRDEWDVFEGRILFNHERYAHAHRDDPDVAAMIARKRAWNDAQQRWGRGVMGFGLYLFRRDD